MEVKGLQICQLILADLIVRIPPGVKVPQLDPSTLAAPMVEYREKYGEAKKRHLGDRKHWYLNLVGRSPERRERGA